MERRNFLKKNSLRNVYIVTIIVTLVAINTQFSIAVHLLAGLGCRNGQDTTSGELARSVNTSASFVRRTLAKLSKARLVETATGKTGACWLAKKPKQISLLDIYRAVKAPSRNAKATSFSRSIWLQP